MEIRFIKNLRFPAAGMIKFSKIGGMRMNMTMK